MSALIKGVKIFNRLNKNPAAIYTVVRNHWNKDFKPGPYPTTDEERRAAAKKYGLLPEEYEPYPDDGAGSGDYPKLPDQPFEQKDIYYPYDFPEYRRNFQEPVHAELDYHEETHVGTPVPLRFSLLSMYLMFTAVMGGSFLLYWWLDDKKLFRPAMPKALPRDGKKHYSFEPAS